MHTSPGSTRPTPTLAATRDVTGKTSTFVRGKQKVLIDFNGGGDGFPHWRRRLASYISDEDVAYGKLIDWARQQPSTINKQVEDNHARGIAEKIGLDVEELRWTF